MMMPKNNNNDETGVTLYHNWAKYYGPKGMMPYFLKTDGAVALVSFFFFYTRINDSSKMRAFFLNHLSLYDDDDDDR